MFSGGGTLGHILPIIPVVRKMKEENPKLKCYFVGTISGLEKKIIEESGFFLQTFYFDSQGFKRKISVYNVITIIKYIKNYYKSKKILKRLEPEIVVGMGGYVTGAVIKAAIALKIKTLIHEQNSIYGMTNFMLRKKVDKVLLSYNIDKRSNAVVVGNPRISEIYDKYKDQIYYKRYFSILAVGGSRGAAKINEIIISLRERFLEKGINVILITGNNYYKKNLEKISLIRNKSFIIKAFVNNLPEYLLKADVVITRSGATTIAEVLALRRICIFIPSPNVTNNHQEKNALELVKRQAALMISEKDLHKEDLFEKIVLLLEDKELRNKMITTINFIADNDACKNFVHEVNGMINK